jgi:anti-sigma regulatory factor (Ser/Thr protein kinase)/anti-anti-sigma regulatory factor
MYTVKLPNLLTIRYANCIIERCENAIKTKQKDVLFDLTNCGFGDPFGIALLVGAIKACQANGHKVFYRHSKNNKLEQHFQNIGFYEWGAGTGGKGKFPLHTAELRHFTAFDPSYVGSVITLLKGMINLSQPVQDSIHLSINEMMTNAFDHSKTVAGCFICAQAFVARGNVSICIADLGIGILAALTSVEKYKYLTKSEDAIKLATEEGVSSRIGVRAGLGLPHIHRFLKKNEGEIHIISGDGWVHWNYKNGNGVSIKTKKLRVAFEGTIVNIIARADAEGIYIIPTGDLEDNIF